MRIIKDADVRKNEILDAAADLFNSDGFDGTTISAIIEKAGIARGTIYYHFKSKEDILDALIDRRNTEFLTAARQGSCQSLPQGGFKSSVAKTTLGTVTKYNLPNGRVS